MDFFLLLFFILSLTATILLTSSRLLFLFSPFSPQPTSTPTPSSPSSFLVKPPSLSFERRPSPFFLHPNHGRRRPYLFSIHRRRRPFLLFYFFIFLYTIVIAFIDLASHRISGARISGARADTTLFGNGGSKKFNIMRQG
ncbi:hypothetical protein ACP275_02G106300 [Erythranthe tilingii]